MSKNLVLWVENEPERLTSFQEDIEDDGNIEFIIKKDAKSAEGYLKDNIEKLSAAVLDIESFINPNSDEETKTSFCRIRDCINTLKHINPIQYFAFTGKGKYLADKEGFKEEYDCEIFDKNYQVFEAEEFLKKIVDNHVIAKISYKYRTVFELSEDIQADLLQILMILENGNSKNSDVYNKIRKVLDWIMAYCYEIGLSQVEFIGTNLADCSRFIGDSKMTDIVPVYIQRSLHTVVSIANEGSHRMTIDADTRNGECPYLISSSVFELLNVLTWLKSLPIDEQSIEERKSKVYTLVYGEKCEHEGDVEQDNNCLLHCGSYLLVNKPLPPLGKKIRIDAALRNKSRNKDIYPFIATDYKVVE